VGILLKEGEIITACIGKSKVEKTQNKKPKGTSAKLELKTKCATLFVVIDSFAKKKAEAELLRLEPGRTCKARSEADSHGWHSATVVAEGAGEDTWDIEFSDRTIPRWRECPKDQAKSDKVRRAI